MSGRVTAEPYHIEIGNSSMVSASGGGVKRGVVNRPSTFTVDISSAGPGEPSVVVKGEIYFLFTIIQLIYLVTCYRDENID